MARENSRFAATDHGKFLYAEYLFQCEPEVLCKHLKNCKVVNNPIKLTHLFEPETKTKPWALTWQVIGNLFYLRRQQFRLLFTQLIKSM